MILLLDIGNSRIKWGFFSQDQFQAGGASQRNEAGLAEMLAAVQAKQDAPARVLVSNVAGVTFSDRLAQYVVEDLQCEIELVTTQAAAFGVINGYAEPQQLGVDRWLALIAARNIDRTATCVVDCGTAVTIDLLNSHGEHLGGMIVPGLALMQTALVNNTEGLNQVSAHKMMDTRLFLARNTAEGIVRGAHYTLLALIERVVADAKGTVNEDVKLIVTGGDGAVLSQYLQCAHQSEPDLVLKGLAMVAEEKIE